MTNTVLLDNIPHASLRVRTGYSAAFGDAINKALVFPTEFAEVQREYPILIRKDENGDYQAMALLGLDKNENLFLDGTQWRARYVPAVQQRGPFLIGFRPKNVDGETVREPMIHVDLDHPRVSNTEGEPLFLAHGGHSPYLEGVTRVLQTIYQGADLAKPMFAAFEEAELIEPTKIEIQLHDRSTYTLPDCYSITAARLAELDGAQLERLNKPGYLRLAIFVSASLGNISTLIDLKGRKRAAGA
jgi:hypothetical protein